MKFGDDVQSHRVIFRIYAFDIADYPNCQFYGSLHPYTTVSLEPGQQSRPSELRCRFFWKFTNVNDARKAVRLLSAIVVMN